MDLRDDVCELVGEAGLEQDLLERADQRELGDYEGSVGKHLQTLDG